MKKSKYEQIHSDVMREAQSLNISEQTAQEAISFMGDLLPTISDYDKDVRLAVFGIACYNAGKNAK